MNLSTQSVWSQLGEDLRRFIRRRVSSHDVADDLLQETFVRIHRGLSELEQSDRVAAWVYRIAQNVTSDYFRRRGPDRHPLRNDPAEVHSEERTTCACGWLNELIEQLPEPYREAIRVVEIEGLPQHALAERFGLTISGAKSRVQRGRAMLRELLDQCCTFEFDSRGNLLDYAPRPERSICHRCENG